MSTLPRWRPRRVDADRAMLHNALGRARQMRFGVDGEQVTLTVSLPAAVEPESSAADRGDSPRVALALDTGVGALQIAPGASFVRLLTGIDVPEEADVAAPLRTMIVEAALQRLPAPWRRAFSFDAARMQASTVQPGELRLRLTGAGDEPLWVGTLRGSLAAMRQCLCAAAWTADGEDPHGIEVACRCRVPVSLGCTELGAAEFAGLARGDVLRVQRPLITTDGEGELRWRGSSLQYRLRPGAGHTDIEFLTWRIRMDTSNDEPIDIGAQASGGEPVPWDQVPVVVSFEVGALELSLAELKSLAPGVVLRIGDHRGANVALRCAGRTVGLGELVELDDSLAVEVTQIGLRH